MPRYNSADDAALWGEGDWEIVPSAATKVEMANIDPAPPTQVAQFSLATQPVLASLTQIQVLIETLRETQLDAVQQELALFLSEAAVLMRCKILGETPPPPEHRPDVFEELDVEDVELIDDQGPQLETSLATQDYLEYELDGDVYEEPETFAGQPPDGAAAAEDHTVDFLDDLEVLDNAEAPATLPNPPTTGPLAQIAFSRGRRQSRPTNRDAHIA